MSELIAVYGTLKQGGSNERVMQRDGGKFIAKATTVKKFTMFGGWGFPRVIYNGPETSHITCEVFEVDGLDNMDSLEGHPHFFCRKEVEVHYDGAESLAWMYFHPHIDVEDNAAYIEHSGEWDHLRGKG